MRKCLWQKWSINEILIFKYGLWNMNIWMIGIINFLDQSQDFMIWKIIRTMNYENLLDLMWSIWMNYKQFNMECDRIIIETYWTMKLAFICHENPYWLLISFDMSQLFMKLWNVIKPLNYWTLLGAKSNYWTLFELIKLLNFWQNFMT